MPRYTPVPYVTERRPRTLRLADLYLRSGEQIADSERRSGEIQAQLWGNVGNAVGQAASTAIMAPQLQREQHAKAAREAQQTELGELQLGAARRDVNDRENLDLAMGQGTRAKVYEALKGRPDLLEQAQQRFAKIDTSFKQLFTDAAEGIAHFGYTPEAAHAALDDLVDNGFDAAKLEPYRQAFTDPAKIRSVVDNILGKTAVAPKTREIKVTNPDGTETIRVVEDTPGQAFTSTPPPKEKPNPTEASLALAAAAGNHDAIRALALIRQQRPPAGPPTEKNPIAVIGPDGQSVYVLPGDAVGKRPGSNREQGRPVTSGDAGDLSEFTTALDDIQTVREALSGNKATGTAAKAGALLWNPITEATGIGMEAKQKQATIDRVKQVIGKALEGGVLRKEDELKYKAILPTIGDPPELVASKLDGLQKAIEKRIQRKMDALKDAGYDTTRFESRQPAPANPGGGVTVTTPDGQTFTFPDQGRADAFKKRAGLR